MSTQESAQQRNSVRARQPGAGVMPALSVMPSPSTSADWRVRACAAVSAPDSGKRDGRQVASTLPASVQTVAPPEVGSTAARVG